MAARQSKAGTGTEVGLLLHLEQDASNDTSVKEEEGFTWVYWGEAPYEDPAP